jgi:hypothetical protein
VLGRVDALPARHQLRTREPGHAALVARGEHLQVIDHADRDGVARAAAFERGQPDTAEPAVQIVGASPPLDRERFEQRGVDRAERLDLRVTARKVSDRKAHARQPAPQADLEGGVGEPGERGVERVRGLSEIPTDVRVQAGAPRGPAESGGRG